MDECCQIGNKYYSLTNEVIIMSHTTIIYHLFRTIINESVQILYKYYNHNRLTFSEIILLAISVYNIKTITRFAQ